MTKLDDKLREILHDYVSGIAFDIGPEDRNDTPSVEHIKQAFADEGYVSPENAKKVQDMVNQMANLAADAFHMPTIQYVKPNKAMTKVQNLMTGQEWSDNFCKYFKENLNTFVDFADIDMDIYNSGKAAAEIAALVAAQRAAGLTND